MKKFWSILNDNKGLVAIIFFGSLIFIWYGYRPSLIKENCSKEASSLASGRDQSLDFLENQHIYDVAYNSAYTECLNSHGI